jgi:hypothetical protein
MVEFGVPTDFITDPVGSDEERDAIIQLWRDAAASDGGYACDPREIEIDGRRYIEMRFRPDPPAGPPADPRQARLGWLAIRYETSGKGSATVSSGRDDPGGVSYGAFQLKSRESDGRVGARIAEFLRSEGAPFAAGFAGATPGSPAFSDAWRRLAAQQPDALFDAELAFILRTHYTPQAARIAAAPPRHLRIADRSRALQEVVFSTAVQHGPNTGLIIDAIAALRAAGPEPADPVDADAALIGAIYRARAARTGSEALKSRYRREEADALRLLAAEDEGTLADAFAAEAETARASGRFRVDASASRHPRFEAFFRERIGALANFTPDEFLVLGGAHAANGLNAMPPPEALWPNLMPLARLLQALRTTVARPVVLNSVYRSPAYNTAIGGAADSQHMRFCAADVCVPGFSSPTHWAGLLRGMRERGDFRGGIGLYRSFVHVDTRGFNVDWTSR